MLTPDRRFAITYNGEIYNFLELREELVRRGYTFRSRTDTEVILYLYAEYGPEMLAKLNGMFAMAIYDSTARTLFLARDRMGIKPLYYYQRGHLFIYASEVKAFLYHPAFHPELNQERLSEYFLFRYVGCPDSLLKGVHSIEPGTYMIVRDGEPMTRIYWKVPEHNRLPMESSEAKVELAELMQSSVRYQLISDVKVGCQLSGGIDSSLVSHWAAEQHGSLFDSVSIVFRDPRFSEEPYIDHVNRLLSLRGHKAYLENDFVLDQFRLITWHNDFPLSHPNCIGIFLLSKEAKRHVTVLLSGEGADEVFGGYPRFYQAAWLLRLNRTPAVWLIPSLKKRLLPFGGLGESLIGLSAFGDPELIAKVYPEFDLDQALGPRLEIWSQVRDGNLLERLLTYEQRTYLVELLMRQDKMCMAHSVENRVPYLDHRVVEFSKSLPTAMKVRAPIFTRRGLAVNSTKRILKGLASDCFGKMFAYRTKSGFPLPLDEVFSSSTFSAAFVEEYRQAISNLGFCNLSEVDDLYQTTREFGGRYSQMFFTVVALALWWKVFKKGPLLQRIIAPAGGVI